MQFYPIDEKSYDTLKKYYIDCRFLVSVYSMGVKIMWKNYRYYYAEDSGCLIVRSYYNGEYLFDYPVKSTNGDETQALKSIAKYCSENSIPFTLFDVPKDKLSTVLSVFPEVEIKSNRNEDDYLYLAEDFIKFEGKKYAGQRNHIRKFSSLYPSAVFQEFTVKDKTKIKKFLSNITAKETHGAKTELSLAKKMVSFIGKDYFVCGGYTYNGEIISFCLSEICGDTLIDHIEKADSSFEGVYPAMVNEFAKKFARNVKYINREEDAGSRGLRISKLQYQPVEILQKFKIYVKNPLSSVKKIPNLQGDGGVSLNRIKSDDVELYNKLCLDDERNKFWGYDYKKDCKKLTALYFYNDQRKDFSNKTAINFAIRKDGEFAGEVVIYNFDYVGGAEIGVRILPKFDGMKIGTESIKIASEYAVYKLGLFKIRAKCLKENIPSYKMLLDVMRKIGEDDEFYYFEKLV